MDPKLYQAVIKGDVASMKELAGPDSTLLFQVTPNGDNILHVAAKYDLNQIAQEIVKLPSSGLLVNQKNSKHDTPLHIAARLGSLKTCQVLVNFANSVSREIEAGEKLIRMVNSNKDTALHDAVRNGYHQVAELLIREDPELTLLTNGVGESPLFIALDKRHLHIAQHILEVAPDFSIDGRNGTNILHVAAIRSKHEVFTIVDYLCELMSYQNIMTDSSFKYGLKSVSAIICSIRRIWAAGHKLGYKNLVAQLMLVEKIRSALSQTDERGWTPLHYAVHFGALDIVELFSEYIYKGNGSAAHVRDGKGRSVIHIAAREGEVVILERLSNLVPEIWDLQDNKGQTPLHLAVATKMLASVRFILRNRLSHSGLINQQDNEGNTALHLAVIQGHCEDIFEFLIKDNRVDKTVANSAGHTILDILLMQDHGYDFKKWFTMTAAINGGLQSWELAINKHGRKTRPNETRETDQAQQPERKLEPAMDDEVIGGQGLKNLNYDQLKQIGNTDALVATLVATVSFAAGFTVPGGYKSDGPDEGTPTLSGISAFRVSVMANVIAFALSTLSMVFHFYSSFMEKLNRVAFYTSLSTFLLIYAIIAMVISFFSGTYASLSHTSGLANAVIAIVCCIAFVFISVVLNSTLHPFPPLFWATRPLDEEDDVHSFNENLIVQSLQRGPVPPSAGNRCTNIPGRSRGRCTLTEMNAVGGGGVAAYHAAPPVFPEFVVKGKASFDIPMKFRL
ncbi:protein ACCELERATED CELL DEATH 6-like [Hibiscus syriacus]|uniref:protein ACCELERATED CELL DEATH 6-like n=1 Tax=Hibiscus syriacus TaxID=106335 RepID=UPI001922CD1E|nr:protein ACCELERATED CELL DEATH 6-like [Hibiscus syriacus]